MTNKADDRVELLQGTLDLIVLRALAMMGAQHAYGLAARLEQMADDPFPLNQGTLYAALIRLDHKGWIKGEWASRLFSELLPNHESRLARPGTADRTMAAPGKPGGQAAG